ncbi:MAG TPA: hypothetical protein VKE42_10585, partial [Candidatus Cybelea sp.]|nr:hypothetical protein [Candidatus Cybelea sp.]
TRVRDADTIFLSCGTKPLDGSRVDPQLVERRSKADRAFDILEAACPKLFSPVGIYTSHLNQMLLRDYINTDAWLYELGGVVHYQGWRYLAPVTLGEVDDIISHKVRIECGFARVPPVAIRVD